MRIAVDTNLLVFAHDRQCPLHTAALAAVARIPQAGDRLVLAAQVALEFYSVITHTRRTHAPLGPVEALKVLQQYLTSPDIECLPFDAVAYARALEFAAARRIRGPLVFDLHLGFTLLAAGVDAFQTHNAKDFAGIDGLRVVDPLA